MSFDLHHLLLVFAAYVVGAASPGPSNMRIMGVAMHQGRRPALSLAAGVISGSFFWGSMAATGISAVLTEYVHALDILKILGGVYLLFLAIKASRSALTSDEKLTKELTAAPSASSFTLYKRGLLMHLTNPKALLGWIATMTLGLGPETSTTTVTVILIGCAILSVTIFCGYAIVFSTAPMIRAYRRARRWFEAILALVFGISGIKLLLART
ncbi:LysE family translocator [Pseudomonas fluorescens]|uniref:LysE family translocator n=1 Tax=Pseudomonas fluorescens TaxID=294 RepID=A0A327NB56_PSEFL|nr:LysE family translocator [Pseudomonas fluorescens]RAI72491.1 LysE family translocator [Pseudomonas fluorescens]